MAYTNENQDQQEQQQPEEQQNAQKGGRNKKKRGNQREQEQEETTETDEQQDYTGEEESEVEGGQDYEGAEDEEIEEEEGEGEDYEEEDEEEEEEPRQKKGHKRPTQVEAIAKKVVKYVDEQTQNLDAKTLAKYAAVGALLFAGMRKSGFLGSIALSVAAGIITKHIAENASDLLDDASPKSAGEQEEEEQEYAEAATA